MHNKIILLISFIFIGGDLFSEGIPRDTLKITIKQAENIFIKENLTLLAQKFNVDATKALIIQARLFPNPTFEFVQGVYNPETKKWFEQDFANGEQAYQISQLILLSHKIKKQTNIAETNFKLAEDGFYNLLQTLKLAIRSNFYNIYFQQQIAKVYDEEITALKTIVAAYQKVIDKGYISQSDNALIQAQLYSLQNEYHNLVDNINDLQSQTRLLLQTSVNYYIQPVVDPSVVKGNPLEYSMRALLDSAYQNRTDLMIARDNLLLSQQNHIYQKSQAVPDITIGGVLDRHGSYVTNYNALTIGFNIPIFNRNQGNIKNAQLLIESSKIQLQSTQKMLDEQVVRGLEKALDADKLFSGIDPAFARNFDTLAKEMMKNYLNRNVSLINFLNFYDSYKQNIVQLNTISYNKVNALENLNFLTATNFYNK
ncbi:MAG: TolC family protein [Bacteroidia bacterium]|nr:TolC family protein [Bacteroidia bacterium]